MPRKGSEGNLSIFHLGGCHGGPTRMRLAGSEMLGSFGVRLAPAVLHWAVIWGGATRMGGGKRTRERALPKIFGPLQKSFWSALSWIFVQEKQSADA